MEAITDPEHEALLAKVGLLRTAHAGARTQALKLVESGEAAQVREFAQQRYEPAAQAHLKPNAAVEAAREIRTIIEDNVQRIGHASQAMADVDYNSREQGAICSRPTRPCSKWTPSRSKTPRWSSKLVPPPKTWTTRCRRCASRSTASGCDDGP